MDRVVLDDPIGEYRQGSIVSGENEIARLARRRVVMLPVDPEMLRQPMGGYVFRSWGAGVNLDRMAGTRICPMAIFVEPSRSFLYWAIRVAPIRPGEPIQGSIRIATDGSTGYTLSGGLSIDVVSNLEQVQASAREPGSVKDWTFYGRGRLSIGLAGWLGISVYGITRNARVVWSAVSQTAEECDPCL